MGIDAEIYFAVNDSSEEIVDDYGYVDSDSVDDDLRRLGITHQVTDLGRYYNAGYERGPWPKLCGVLMALLADPAVAKVWYCGDHCDVADIIDRPTTVDDVLAISRHYMTQNHRARVHILGILNSFPPVPRLK